MRNSNSSLKCLLLIVVSFWLAACGGSGGDDDDAQDNASDAIDAAGGRITEYKIQSWHGSGWRDILTSPKPAAKTHVRHRFAPLETTKIRLLIISATVVPTLYEFEVYARP